MKQHAGEWEYEYARPSTTGSTLESTPWTPRDRSVDPQGPLLSNTQEQSPQYQQSENYSVSGITEGLAAARIKHDGTEDTRYSMTELFCSGALGIRFRKYANSIAEKRKESRLILLQTSQVPMQQHQVRIVALSTKDLSTIRAKTFALDIKLRKRMHLKAIKFHMEFPNPQVIMITRDMAHSIQHKLQTIIT
jgi:hypothetical protein